MNALPDGRAETLDRPATARVFFGLWPTPELAGQLSQIADAAARQFGGKATRRETIHLTLVFLGDVPEMQLPTLCAIASRLQPGRFDLSLNQLGVWRHNRLLWAGCTTPPPALLALVGELRLALGREGFAVDGRERAFTPHVTLVRKLPKSVGPEDCARMPAIDALYWPCEHFVLIRSRQVAGGSSYQTIATFPTVA